MKFIFTASLVYLLIFSGNVCAQRTDVDILVKCELTRDIRETAPLGGRPFETHWSEARINAVLSPAKDTTPFLSYELKNVRPGEYLLKIRADVARNRPYMKIELKRTQRFPYEAQLIHQLTDDEIRSREVTLNLTAIRKFTRRVARYLQNKETGEPVVGVKIALMKFTADGEGANQVAVTTTDAEGFFQFLIWDDWKYSISPKLSFDDFGVVNEPSKEVIEWVPNDVFEDK